MLEKEQLKMNQERIRKLHEDAKRLAAAKREKALARIAELEIKHFGKPMSKAVEWYVSAADQGDLKAKALLEDLGPRQVAALGAEERARG